MLDAQIRVVGIGVLGAVWSATGWIDAFFRVANSVYAVPERRGFVRRKLLQIALAVGLGLVLVLLGVLVVVTGPLAGEAGDAIGAADGLVTAWSIAKWPVAAGVAALLIAILYRLAADVERRRRWITPGALTALLAWAAASFGFGVYVAKFGSYNATYGALGGVIVFLVWLWLAHAALILGLVVDSIRDGGDAPPDPAGETER